MSENKVEILYKAIDEVSAVVQKIIILNKELAGQVAQTSVASVAMGKAMSQSLQPAIPQVSKAHAEFAKLNEVLKRTGLELDTIDIYMLSALKVMALFKTVSFFKEVVFEAEKFKNTIAGISDLSEYFSQSSTKYFKALTDAAADGVLSVQQLTGAMRNLVNARIPPELAGKTLEALKVTATILGRQMDMPIEEAITRATQGLLKLQVKLLDNTNAVFTLEQAERAYIKTHQLLTNVLSDQEKRFAVAEMFIKVAEPLTNSYNASLKGLTGSVGSLSFAWSQLRLSLGAGWGPAMKLLTDGLTGLINTVRGSLEGVEIGVTRLSIRISMLGQAMINIGSGKFGQITTDWKQSIRDLDTVVEDIMLKWEDPAHYAKIRDSLTRKPTGMRIEPTPIDEHAFLKFTQSMNAWGDTAFVEKINKVDLKFQELKDTLEKIEGINEKINAPKKQAALEELQNKARFEKEEIVKEFENKKKLLAQQEAEFDIRSKISSIEAHHLNLDISRATAVHQLAEQYALLVSNLEAYVATLDRVKDNAAWAAHVRELEEARKKMQEFGLEVKKVDQTFSEGMKRGLKEYVDTAKTAFEHGVQFTKDIANAMTSTMQDLFFDIMQGKIKKFGDYIMAFARMIQQAIAKMIAEMITKMIMAKLFTGVFGGILTPAASHQGGLIRMHSGGLAYNEVPRILKSGEYVINDNSVKKFGVGLFDKLNAGMSPQGGSNYNISVPVNVEGNRQLSVALQRNIERTVEMTIRKHL